MTTFQDGIPMAMPLVGADMARVEQLRPVAQDLSNDLGLDITLVHFTNRTDVEIINPEPKTKEA